MTIKKYDYHSSVPYAQLLLFSSSALVIFDWSLWNKSLRPLSELVFIYLCFVIVLVLSIVAYMNAKSTFVEISDDGILFNTWRRKILASWEDVREVRLGGRRNKIFTNKGNFAIGYLEPADAPRNSTGILKNQGKYLDELTDEIKRRATRANITYAPFVRPNK